MRRDKTMSNYDTMLKMHRQEELDAQIEELEESISDIDEEIEIEQASLETNAARLVQLRSKKEELLAEIDAMHSDEYALNFDDDNDWDEDYYNGDIDTDDSDDMDSETLECYFASRDDEGDDDNY